MLVHASHPEIANRLKRAHGHLKRILEMMEEGRPCLDLAQQLQAVESAVGNAKKALIHDHIDLCLEEAVQAGRQSPAEMLGEIKTLTRYL
ncbi:metal-sensing transcriptional repressor [Radicibacter daui]|uniref:metal-sensing transcriptional repressor n=1 Tax=Radicibacter daui TaxID=3064829 RepID=UPI004046B2B8